MLVYDITDVNIEFGFFIKVYLDTLEVYTYTFNKEYSNIYGEYIFIGDDDDDTFIKDKINIHHKQTITLNTLKNLPEWEDYTIWNLLHRSENRRYELTRPINRNAYTMGSKFNRYSFLTMWGNVLFELVIPHKGIESFEEVGISVLSNMTYPLITNIQPYPKDTEWFDDPDRGMQSKLRHILLPTMEIIGPNTVVANDTGNFTLNIYQNEEAFYKPFSVYIDSTGGYLPLTKIEDVIHTTQFIVSTGGLTAGQKFTIKVGAKYWSSIAEKEITIV